MVTVVSKNAADKLSNAGDNDEGKKIHELIFNYVSENKFEELKNLLSEHTIPVDILDEDGTTPLLHACYKGNKNIVEFLIEKGADVNNTHHKHKYTALHFAALSGNSDVCLSLMTAGAKSSITNSIGKTASQMAAFVGNHQCVAVINNFVPKSDVEYYIIPRGVETKPKLLPMLCTPLHAYIMQVNIHPVRLAMKMPDILIKEYSQVKKVLELMCEKEMKKGTESNEVLAFKFHYLAYMLNEVRKCDNSKKQTDPAETFAKKILKGSRGEEYLELLLKDCVREFPYRDGFLFQQMVKSLARKEDAPPALNVVLSTINGQSSFSDESSPCVTCSQPKAIKKCSKCKAVQYCDRECQRLHWFVHKKECDRSPKTGSGKEDKNADEPVIDVSDLTEGLQI